MLLFIKLMSGKFAPERLDIIYYKEPDIIGPGYYKVIDPATTTFRKTTAFSFGHQRVDMTGFADRKRSTAARHKYDKVNENPK
jgi:hypothetical protein